MKKYNHIWIFSDSILGHEIQSQALATRLSDNISLFHCSLRQPWLSFAPRILPRFGRNIIWQDKKPNLSQPPDLIITCGRRMAAIGKYFKRKTYCTHIQILNPGDDSKKYDLLICPEHDGIKGSNVITTKGSVHAISVSSLNQIKQNCPEHAKPQTKKSIVLFLGNPAKGFYKDLGALVSQIKNHFSEMELYICGSRRTPVKYFATIKQHFNFAKTIWLSEIDGDNPYTCLLACSDVIIVSADSINMVSEACASDKPVIAIAQQFISPKHKRFINSISSRLSDFGSPSLKTEPIETLNKLIAQIVDR